MLSKRDNWNAHGLFPLLLAVYCFNPDIKTLHNNIIRGKISTEQKKYYEHVTIVIFFNHYQHR